MILFEARPSASKCPPHFNLLPCPHLVLELLRQLGAETLHPGEVLLTPGAPAAEGEPLEQGLLPLLHGEAEVVDPVVVGDLLASSDPALGHHQHLGSSGSAVQNFGLHFKLL